MPILTRQPEAMGTAAIHLASTRRRGGSTIDQATCDEPSAVRLAYALRWLEFDDGDARAIWPPTEVRQTA